MPGTTRYSATFDRTYEEEDRVDPPPHANARRSRSLSLQAIDGRPYTPLGGRPPNQRSSSTDNGPTKGPEHIPTRTAKTTARAHNNPFQFVKVGTCSLYRKAEEQLQTVKEVKKPDVLKEEEEEWQVNLDSWKSRRRKMSEDVFRRQEEIKQFEMEEQSAQLAQKKTKTFSEMVESRATRGRALSLCLLTSPLEFQNWEFENKTYKNGSCSFTDESGENSTVNSEDEGVSVRGRLGKASLSESEINNRTNGDAHIEQNGSKLGTQNGDYNKLSDNVQMKPKESPYVDSGLESISSSHRAGDTPDSGSDFSHDSNSSIDCDSPRTGVDVLEEFTSKSPQMSQGHEITVKLNLKEKGQDFGFTFLGGKDEGQVLIASVLEGSKAESSGIHLGDKIITIDGNDVSSKKHIEIAAMLQKSREKGQINLVLWRHTQSAGSTNGFSTDEKHIKPNKSENSNAKSYEKSVESENEMYVDDFEELRRQSELPTSNKKSETCTNAQAQTNGNKPPIANKGAIPLKTSSENSAAPKSKDNLSNGAVEERNKNEQTNNSELNNENQKKNVVKVKRVRRKGVYALNVDPNQIPQDGISVNSLSPLSPVTELPSPADEIKTLTATLSSNNATATHNSLNGVSQKERSRDAENKLSSPIAKDKNKTSATTPKTTISKTDVPPVETKITEKVENNISEEIERKTESASIPSSPTATSKEKTILSEDSLNEKSKPPTTPKKVKVKVKKGTTSENVSATSPNVKEPSSSLPLTDVSVKNVKGVEDSVVSQIRETGPISSETISTTPVTEAVTVKNKISATGNISYSNSENQSSKVTAKTESVDSSSSLLNDKQSKITTITSENDKPKPVVQKKIKVKPKANTTEQIPSDLPQVVKETSTTSTSNTSDSLVKNTVKESQPKKEQIPAQDKQVKIVIKNETAVSPVTRETDASSALNTTAILDMKPTAAEDKTQNISASADKNKNLSLKIDAKNESENSSSVPSVTNAKPPKTPQTPQSEKSIPVFSQKKEIIKPQGSTTEQISPDSSQVAKDTSISSDSNISDSPLKNRVKESLPKKELKAASVTHEKQAKLPAETVALPPRKESAGMLTGITTLVPDMKPTSEKDKIVNISASTDKNKSISLKLDAKSESENPSPITVTKSPKTPQGEKSKPAFPQKKESSKLKGDTTEHISSDCPQVVTKASLSSDSSSKNIVKESLPKQEQKSTILIQDKQLKLATKNETAVSPVTMGNSVMFAETTTFESDTKFTSTRDIIPNASVSSDKNKNLSLNVDVKIESENSASAAPATNAKPAKTPQRKKSKPAFSQKEGSTELKEDYDVPAGINTVTPTLTSSKDMIPDTSASSVKNNNLSLKVAVKSETENLPSTLPVTDVKPPKTPLREKSKSAFSQKKENTKLKENDDMSAGITTVTPDTTPTSSLDIIPITSTSSNKNKNLSLKVDVKNESENLSSTSPVTNVKPPKTPQGEKSKPAFSQKKENTKLKENDGMSAGITTVIPDTTPTSSKNMIPNTSTSSNKKKSLSLKVDVKNESENLSSTSPVTNVKPPKTPQGEKSKPAFSQKKENTKLKENDDICAGITTVLQDTKPTCTKDMIPSISASIDKNQNVSLKVDVKSESKSLSSISPVNHVKPPKTPQGEKSKPAFSQKKENAKLKENDDISDCISTDVQDTKPTSTKMIPSTSASTGINKNLSVKVDVKSESESPSSASTLTQVKQPKTPQGEKSKPAFSQKKENKLKEKDGLPAEISTVIQDTKPSSTKDMIPSTSASTDINKNLPLKVDVQSESESPPLSSTVTRVKQPKTPQGEKSKPAFSQKKENTKLKGNATEQISSESSQVVKDASISSDSSSKDVVKEILPKKEQKSTVLTEDKQAKLATKSETAVSHVARENSVMSAGITAVVPDTKRASSKDKNRNTSASPDKNRNLSLKIDTKCELVNSSSTSPVTNAKPPKTPQGDKPKPVFSQKKENTKLKGKSNLTLVTSAVSTNIDKNELQKSPSATVCNNISSISSVTSDKSSESVTVSSEVSALTNDVPKSPVILQGEKSPVTKKPRKRSKKKNTNSQKVNIPAKQNEELMNSNDSLNIVFQSQPKNMCSEIQPNNVKNSENNSSKKGVTTDLVPDVPPVEKVAEEMEKLILKQLEEEEQAKELSLGLPIKSPVESPEHLLTAPPRLAEPPKEKPPPPPSSASEGNQKESSLKRVNSTKRIKKEIHKRRSNFLGIDNADENIACNESSIQPPAALEEILKAEMELDRQSRLKIESATTERLTLEEKEIMLKEREIIESLESEERRNQLLNGIEDCKDVTSNCSSDKVSEQDRIESLKNERKRIETERQLNEEQQQIHLLEEKQLREREEFIRKQEANKTTAPLSDTSLSVAANVANTLKKPALSSSLPTEALSNVSLSGTNGDGVISNSSTDISKNKTCESDEQNKVPQKPAVPPKPLKKKEAIRKERERLRQEQEALQREREEHRRKLMLEQEELMKHQKSHAPDAPVSRLGPLPPLVQPAFPPQLTSTMNATPNARESASFPSRSHHGALNGATGSMNTVELMGPPVVRQNRLPAPRKAVQNEAWGQQKMPSVHKQNHDSLTESRYNQNHWLIQEAEMRRITELKERQRAGQLPCSQTHLAEDDVCSNPPRVPVITPPHNPHLNYAVQDKMWNYGQSNIPLKKYPPPVVKEPPLHTIYPRETVSQQPPTKPSRVVPMEKQEQMLSVSGRKRCSHCNEELGRGAAMIIESLQLYYHIHCFQCCVCQAQLGNGSRGTDVRVRNNKLHCHNCYSNDEAGLKFSQV